MQNIQRWGRVAGAGVIVAALTACAAYPQGGYNQPGYPGQPTASYPAPSYPAAGYPNSYPVHNSNQGYQVQQGRIVNIETMRVQDSSGVGAGGAIVGGVLGGLVGHQIGGGSGKALATAAGVVGGALAGNAVQSNVGGGSVRDIYRVTVETRDGSLRAFDYPNPPQLNVGDYVRIENDQIYR
ncbi:glycine zipper 2TM domain-containing protein [Pantoea sp. 18069]|uniref:glycine zipper 2TM domain-containing protein n=1 Tax=Pantoea sp. 18069 TaxID=2681415 RepID=UPI00135BFD34|nr:glycine zipper 2TM domain-containing protein [Pantoea sp. 18069]